MSMSSPSFPVRSLGQSGPEVSTLGLGCMGMSHSYGAADEQESIATLERATELGITFFDTADVYRAGHNETLIGRALGARREEVVLATKFGMSVDGSGTISVNGRPEYVRACCDASLQRLGSDYIDLYYQHRVDPSVPIEDTIGAMAELVQAGKVRHLGLSEASAQSLERAASVHPIAALQSEWSLWTRDLEEKVVPTARRLGIGIVPFSPLGRGFLTGTVVESGQFEEGDSRSKKARFARDNLDENLARMRRVEAVANEVGCTAAQLALAWLLAQGPDIVPIPGTKRRSYLESNVAAVQVTLTQDVLDRLEEISPPGAWAGERYDAGSHSDYGDSPLR
jgi:aryl-alcohol dehydrogenase-like predicted oxidoreductase